MDEDFVKLVQSALHQMLRTGNPVTIIVPGSTADEMTENQQKICKSASKHEDQIEVEKVIEHGRMVVVLHPKRG